MTALGGMTIREATMADLIRSSRLCRFDGPWSNRPYSLLVIAEVP
jgi:hypothetical protein